MIKMQHALPALPHSLKAQHKAAELAGKGGAHSPDNARVRAETLNDSLEEIGAMFSEKMERRQKALNRRNTQRGLSRSKQSVGKIDQLNQLVELLDGGDGQAATEQLEWLRDAMRQSPPPDNATLLEKTGGDPTRSERLLRILGQEAEESGDNALIALVSDRLQQLHQTHGNSIRAGNNTATAIAGHTRDPQKKQHLRNLYYDSIVHQQSAMVMLDRLLEQTESRDLLPTLRTLQRALADDIAALAPSISPAALGRIHRGLRDAAQISQTLAGSSAFLKRMASKLPTLPMTALTLARRTLQISHNGAYQSDYQHLAQEILGQSTQHLPLFFSGLFPLINGLPPSLWPEPDNRKNALSLLRSMITDVSKTEQREQLRQQNEQE